MASIFMVFLFPFLSSAFSQEVKLCYHDDSIDHSRQIPMRSSWICVYTRPRCSSERTLEIIDIRQPTSSAPAFFCTAFKKYDGGCYVLFSCEEKGVPSGNGSCFCADGPEDSERVKNSEKYICCEGAGDNFKCKRYNMIENHLCICKPDSTEVNTSGSTINPWFITGVSVVVFVVISIIICVATHYKRKMQQLSTDLSNVYQGERRDTVDVQDFQNPVFSSFALDE